MKPRIPDWVRPQWPAPPSVQAVVTTRGRGGGAYGEFNLAHHVGDNPKSVDDNREHLRGALGVMGVQWLRQVHGTGVVQIGSAGRPAPEGDALYTATPHIALTMMTADCLPVIFCDLQGREIAVAHAGWRGLAAGVLEYTVARFAVDADQLMAWMGPAIGRDHFEVGAEVRSAFLDAASSREAAARAFTASGRAGHFYCDLYALARLRLYAAGVKRVYGGGFCTFSDRRFYSYRAEQVCGRMATAIWLR